METSRVRGFTISCMTSLSIGECRTRNLPGIGEYGMLSIWCSAQAHTSWRSGGVHASRHRASRYSFSGIIKNLFESGGVNLRGCQAYDSPTLERGREVLLGIIEEASGCQMPTSTPNAALDLNEYMGIFPSKVRTPAAGRYKLILAFQHRATERIPHAGEAFFQYRGLLFSFRWHMLWRVVKSQGVKLSLLPPESAPVPSCRAVNTSSIA